ncbi:SecD/SecF fusion protein [Roseimicrobium gellanilyticum]|uniref:Multifunctional fusion protein n=1 Tax=Roseimicrobium gellanilyticum TaxID=748857 RepID=A0A366HIJ2_9BACT|nr:protein translocase subunit SecD [Roseimicrobium gellanilyticum]RBP42576.1 SecD/SecF fusion protein [Roseimicrobium gellanilyticum]
MKSLPLTFFWGAALIFLLMFYMGTTEHRKKKLVGTILTVAVSLFCIWAVDGWNVFTNKPLNLKMGMDLIGGSEFIVQLKPGLNEKGEEKQVNPDSVQQAIATLQKRLDPNGSLGLTMTPQGDKQIVIQMPGVEPSEIATVRQQIQQTAHLEFRLVHPQSEQVLATHKAQGGGIEPGFVAMPSRERKNKPDAPEAYLVKNRPDMDGTHVNEAWVAYPPTGLEILMNFDGPGSTLFGELTTANVGQRFAIIVDGEVLSAPVIQTAITGGHCVITGDFEEKEARNLATALQNPLKNPMEILADNTVSAQFGQETIKQAIYTGIAGLIMTAAFLLIYYRTAGLIALVGLVVNMLMVFGAMSLFNFTMTMPGIAGIVLTVGMAVDANVLIYERLREEMKTGKTLAAALDAAFHKAFSAIFDANFTTLISAVILFTLGSGLIKGFAITLTVGIIGTLLGGLVVTRVVFNWFTDAGILKKITVTQIIPEGIFDMLSKARPFIIGSFSLAAISALAFVIKGEDAIGIDFRGGAITRFQVAPNAGIDAHTVEKTLLDAKIDGTYVQQNSTGTGQQISVRSDMDDGPKVKDLLEQKFAGKLTGGQSDRVGASIGKDLAVKSIIAFGCAMLGIFLYLVIFYEMSFAMGAIIALLHDCVITIGLAVLLGQQLSVIHIGALLTVAGYSINDTIVVFDRIREIIKARTGDIRDIMNEAISMTLSRTLLTGVTTLGPMAALYFFGGQAMKDLSLPIIIGVLVGTYSSIYIASPIVLWYAKKTGTSLRRQVLDTEASREAANKPPVVAS